MAHIVVETLRRKLGLGFEGFVARLSRDNRVNELAISVGYFRTSESIIGLTGIPERRVVLVYTTPPQDKIRFSEPVTKWAEFEEGVFDNSIGPDVVSRTLLTIDQRMQKIKSRLPNINITVVLKNQGRNITNEQFRAVVDDAKNRGLQPYK